ncbi:4-hydroxy-tetrahydrodipicolinate reductase [Secundilactobacillus malefermentans]|uniref:4-hydroxy-tetrahydrodipicolinate reductase n=1 Tax=Secundilactobacillus malefermentans TaxID=176292 RepID=UPI0011C7EEA6|nr:4-hydroxy-tetrahydrodipicolinate reductase [Secundilactobacillus malefermentans]QEA31658.1 4-hydroxy-tetrahydrodipicolinate reductase [Secundilactobacillus malefermentans]
MTKVIVAGFTGAMGDKAVHLVADTAGFELTAVFAPNLTSTNPADFGLAADVQVFQSLAKINTDAEIWIDFTLPSAVYANTKFAIENGISPVIGTTGLTDSQVTELQKLAAGKKLGGIIAPNFGMSAVLLMKFAKEAAQYFPDVEIIEMHHDHKKDAPSGTALSTAKMINEVREPHQQGNPEETETLANVRGGDYHGIHIHSVRLPGYVAHEQVLFGGAGEALTIRQDSFDRGSFMSGVEVALTKVKKINELVVGLENVL